ncbi:MAG: hypothetical protein HGB21_04815 [Nitrospirae bacterium]|nr:hypothetical protein [Nitrospirota bacterium]NTW65624.1 hypothetical protein [Nitrospirota bacterium]
MTTKRIVAVAFSAISAAVIMMACAGTKLVAQWRDDAYSGRASNVFVIALLLETRVRGPQTLVEDEFVKQLKARGTEAVASYTVFPEGPRPTKDEVLAKVKELGADSILVVRMLKKGMGDTHTPTLRYATPSGFDQSWSSYGYMSTSTEVGIRDVSYDYDFLSAEVTLYQTATGNPIWSAMSQTTYQEGPLKQIKPFTTTIMKGLSHAKVIE